MVDAMAAHWESFLVGRLDEHWAEPTASKLVVTRALRLVATMAVCSAEL